MFAHDLLRADSLIQNIFIIIGGFVHKGKGNVIENKSCLHCLFSCPV